ncbi:MAG: CAAX prenyl protease-related protein [Betaproteobacteria bacterium]|nr:CAAX prenyl protease-related protein [Betaproteobacteria bacterium]
MRENPAFSRILPFALYLLFLSLEGSAWLHDGWPRIDWRWLYAVKISVVAGALLYFWSRYEEIARPRLSLREGVIALVVGAAVFGIWITLDGPWVKLWHPNGYDPRGVDGSVLWLMASIRLFGAAVIVPVMEELFWRSFVMRWIERQDFLKANPSVLGANALLISSALFAVEHHQWAAGLIAGLGYGWLYIRSGNLWVPILAHGFTNMLLGLWVLRSGQWQFW